MPIRGRIDMLATGMRGALGLKITGPSTDGIQELASISTRNNSVTRLACFGDSVTTQANWMISFLPPNQGIGVG
jgi:hypothetical protein